MEKTNETLESIKIEEKEEKVSYERLEEEIKIEEESRKLDNIENFKKSQKPKKKLKNKILAWVLGSAIFAGAAAGGGYLIYDNVAGDKAYNEAIQTRYEQVDEKLAKALDDNFNFSILDKHEVTHIRFLEPNEESANLQVFYEVEDERDYGTLKEYGYAVFNVLIDYYNTLIEAESTNNALLYLDALEKVFENMQYVEHDYNTSKIAINLRDESEAANFNEIFNLNDVENEDIVKQVGFLPYHIEVVDYHHDEATNRYDYTYKISGISYCETKSENSDTVKNHEDLIIENGYKQNHIKAYQRDILYTATYYNEVGISMNHRLWGDIRMIIDGINNPYTVKTSLFKEVNLFKMYEEMQEGKFDYKKPKGFNVKNYMESFTEEKPNTEDYEIL